MMRAHLVLMALTMVAVSFGTAFAGVPAWSPDEGLGFHFAYYDPVERVPNADWKTIPAVRVNPDTDPGAADITNIDLDGIRGLGFPLPPRPAPGSFTFFLKFFEFPEWLSTAIAVEHVMSGYKLHLLPEQQRLRAWLMNRDHLRVKKAVIAPSGCLFSGDRPYPALILPQRNVLVGVEPLSPQAYFERQVPFLSLYLKPTGKEPSGISEDERVAWSGNGVKAFHKALLEAWGANFETLPGAEPDAFTYFRVPSGTEARTVTILKVPATPATFEKNWRDLPMPENPRKVFLSALLLVFRNEYLLTGTLEAGTAVDSPEFRAVTRPLAAQVLEVGSVVRQP